MEPKTIQTLCMLVYAKGSDSEKLVREVEPKQSDYWKLQWFFSASNFVVRVLIRFVDVAKVTAERNSSHYDYFFH